MIEYGDGSKNVVFDYFSYISKCAANGSRVARMVLLTKMNAELWHRCGDQAVIFFLLGKVEAGDKEAEALVRLHTPRILDDDLPMPDVRIEKHKDGATVRLGSEGGSGPLRIQT